jgi:hypothetical protein
MDKQMMDRSGLEMECSGTPLIGQAVTTPPCSISRAALLQPE